MSDHTPIDEQHLDDAALDRYRRRTADPSELLSSDAHLATCNRCFERVRAEDTPVRLHTTHVPYEELAAFVDHEASTLDRELVVAHTAHCTRCRDELTDLMTTRDTLNATRPAEYRVRALRART
jgi:anti-sigma factor RsiW